MLYTNIYVGIHKKPKTRFNEFIDRKVFLQAIPLSCYGCLKRELRNSVCVGKIKVDLFSKKGGSKNISFVASFDFHKQ